MCWSFLKGIVKESLASPVFLYLHVEKPEFGPFKFVSVSPPEKKCIVLHC